MNFYVEGLTGDWLVSRQRFFGVPLPLWYPVRDDGEVDYDSPIRPSEDELPIDPSDAVPPGYEESQRGEPGEAARRLANAVGGARVQLARELREQPGRPSGV